MVFLVGLIVLAAPVRAAWILEYDGQISSNLHGSRFKRPSSVSLDPVSRELCVTDKGTRALSVFNDEGAFTFATNRVSSISIPDDAVIDSQGGFVLTDSEEGIGRRIRRLNFLGEPVDFPVEKPRPDWFPERLILTRRGDIVSIDVSHSLMCKHHGQTGELLWQTTIAAEEDDTEFVLGRPVEAPDGRLYVPGGNMHRVLIYDSDGGSIGSFGFFGTTRGQMVFPIGVAIGPERTVLVLDRMRHVILLFDSEHRFLAEFGSFGAGPGQFYHPNSITCAEDGRVFVSQGFEGRVQGFRLSNTRATDSRENPDRAASESSFSSFLNPGGACARSFGWKGGVS